MKINNIIISVLLFTCFILYTTLELKTPSGNDNTRARQIQLQNDSLKQQNKMLDEKYLTLKIKTDSLQQKLSTTRQTIVQLKNKQHEKIIAINTLSNDELFGFFSKFDTESSNTK